MKPHEKGHLHFYHIYHLMWRRCYQQKHRSYPWYGGKGIEVKWKSYEAFRDDMYEEYMFHALMYGKKNTQIDRTDPNGHYEKSNCRFVTPTQQQSNKTNSRKVTYNGRTESISEWARILNKKATILYHRAYKGYTPRQILFGVDGAKKGVNKTGYRSGRVNHELLAQIASQRTTA